MASFGPLSNEGNPLKYRGEPYPRLRVKASQASPFCRYTRATDLQAPIGWMHEILTRQAAF